jgi:hypothetical protein
MLRKVERVAIYTAGGVLAHVERSYGGMPREAAANVILDMAHAGGAEHDMVRPLGGSSTNRTHSFIDEDFS